MTECPEIGEFFEREQHSNLEGHHYLTVHGAVSDALAFEECSVV